MMVDSTGDGGGEVVAHFVWASLHDKVENAGVGARVEERFSTITWFYNMSTHMADYWMVHIHSTKGKSQSIRKASDAEESMCTR